MLHRFNTQTARLACESPVFESQGRYNRNEEEDIKTAISYLYEFKRKLDALHPNCVDIISHILSNRNY